MDVISILLSSNSDYVVQDKSPLGTQILEVISELEQSRIEIALLKTRLVEYQKREETLAAFMTVKLKTFFNS